MRFPLNYHGPGKYPDSKRHFTYSKTDQIASTKLAVDSQIENGEIADGTRILQADAESPDVLRFERRLLADELALIPRVAFLDDFHDSLLGC